MCRTSFAPDVRHRFSTTRARNMLRRLYADPGASKVLTGAAGACRRAPRPAVRPSCRPCFRGFLAEGIAVEAVGDALGPQLSKALVDEHARAAEVEVALVTEGEHRVAQTLQPRCVSGRESLPEQLGVVRHVAFVTAFVGRGQDRHHGHLGESLRAELVEVGDVHLEAVGSEGDGPFGFYYREGDWPRPDGEARLNEKERPNIYGSWLVGLSWWRPSLEVYVRPLELHPAFEEDLFDAVRLAGRGEQHRGRERSTACRCRCDLGAWHLSAPRLVSDL